MAEKTIISPSFETTRLRLRPLAKEDVTGLHGIYGDPETMRFWDMLPSRDEVKTAERLAFSSGANPEYHATWSVFLKNSNEMVGAINYHARVPWNRRLALGWIVNRAHWRRGIMAEAVPALLGYCFDGLGTHRIEALIEPENAPSIALAERLGFQWEGGLLRHHLLVGEEWRDVRMYALLEDEWRSRKPGSAARP